MEQYTHPEHAPRTNCSQQRNASQSLSDFFVALPFLSMVVRGRKN